MLIKARRLRERHVRGTSGAQACSALSISTGMYKSAQFSRLCFGKIAAVMKVTAKQVLAIPCPTCGAKPGEKCELNSGQPRSTPHLDRSLAAGLK
jgi:hypothetical protein